MTALELRRVSYGGPCCMSCPNKGRYEIFMAGYPLLNAYGRELVCEKHGKEWAALFRELAPDREHIEQTIAKIAGTPAQRMDAVDQLHEWGFTNEDCVKAMKLTGEGCEPGVILDRLLGVVELEAVA